MVKLELGVLVKLSANGRKTQGLRHIKPDDVGIVIGHPKTKTQRCYSIRWSSGETITWIYRREVKFADNEQRKLNTLIVRNRILKEKYNICE